MTAGIFNALKSFHVLEHILECILEYIHHKQISDHHDQTSSVKCYVDRWDKRLDLENLIYRPLLLKILPFLCGVLCRVLDSLVDGLVLLLRQTVNTSITNRYPIITIRPIQNSSRPKDMLLAIMVLFSDHSSWIMANLWS